MDNIVTTVGDSGTVSGRGNVTVENNRLKSPSNIIIDVHAARTYYETYRRAHTERVRKYASIDGLISGNAPYDRDKLRAAGLSHVTNVNTLDAKNKFDKASLAFWNLLNQTESYVKFTIDNLGVQQDRNYARWAQIMEKEWTTVIKEHCPWFKQNVNINSGQLLKYGFGPIMWPDERSYKWESVEVSRFFIADQARVDSESWSCVCMETVFTMQQLFALYEAIADVEGDIVEGWVKDALATFILFRANVVNKNQNSSGMAFTNMSDLQQMITNGDINAGTIFTDTFTLVHMLYREYSGKISHYIFDPVPNATSDFLLKLSEQYETFEEVVTVFTYSPEERTVHGNRGVGHKIFALCQATTQLDCTIMDMTKMGSTLLMKSTAGVGREIAPVRITPGVVADVGQMDIVQNQLNANVDKVIMVADYFNRKVDRNAINGGDDPSVKDSDRGSKSSEEVQIQSLKEFGVGKNNVSHFYDYMDRVYMNMVVRMLRSKENDPGYAVCKKWKERCLNAGVPKEVFTLDDNGPKNLKVRAARVAGDGSTAGLVVSLNRIGSVAGAFGQEGQQNYRRDIVRANLGDDYAERYLSDSMTPDEAAGGSSLAMLENIVMKSGESPMVSRDNQHKSHIGIHMAQIMDAIKKVQAQEMDPIEADKLFAVTIDHVGQHIQIVQEDILNEGYVKQLSSTMKQINKFAQLNRARAQKMMQAEMRRRAQEEEQMNADMMEQRRKDMVTEREEARKDFKVQAQVKRAEEASNTRADIMKRDIDKKAENQRRDIELKNANKRQEIQQPKDIMAGTSTEELRTQLVEQVGNTPNPVDFK